MKLLAALALFVVGATIVQAQTIGAAIQAQTYDSATNSVKLKIANMSHKDITAFNIAITETYADGRVEKHELLEELVGKILMAQELRGTSQEQSFRQRFGDGGFHPGEIHDELMPVQPGLSKYQAVVDVVTYSDGTAASSNDSALQRIVDGRKATVATKKMATEIMKSALADPNDPDPSMTAAKNIQDKATVWTASEHTNLDVDPVVLESIARELQKNASRGGNKREMLQQVVDREEANISMLAVHTTVVKTGGPQ
jgi:hypothetical protein